MKKISRRDFLKAGSGTIITLSTADLFFGCADSHSSGSDDTPDTIQDNDVDVYRRLQIALDTIPNGFPASPDGTELRILRKIFLPEEADLFCDLRLTFETALQISERTGRPMGDLESMLVAMTQKGQIYGIKYDDAYWFHMIPWMIGLFMTQRSRQDQEFHDLVARYRPIYGRQLISYPPQLLKIVPISKTIPAEQQPLPYQDVASIIENGVEFYVRECVCKKENARQGHPCSKPTDVCLQINAIPDTTLISGALLSSREISKEEAYQILDQAEEAGLVHMSSNVQAGNAFICNCCACCCLWLSGIEDSPFVANIVNSPYFADIDPDLCQQCGICLLERCPAGAIEEGEESYQVNQKQCIGCGLCVTTCPTSAAALVHKPESAITPVPFDMEEWNDLRAASRGVDYSKYK